MELSAEIQIQPLQFNLTVDQATLPDGSRAVLMQFSTPMGLFIFFAEPEKTMMMAKALADAALQARTGIILPDGAIPSPGDPRGNAPGIRN